ncbi:anti-phage defense-associated sirtuin Dsr1 [Arenibacterium sp. LLYu02]|uniref:anti-phage defense-associated sirtuin Dsr1 n=1 Tax=Arenibacterium sp. LLYu02 TaxID=3404132 RepID=UPI003B218FDC
MQFIANGPDVPDELLMAHEEGNVVFFCGAGISYPAGLPGFRGLVEDIYKTVGTTRLPTEQEAFERSQYDATLDLLERRVPGQRLTVRRALEKALKPKLRRKGATDTHSALLTLARSREGAIRLVTTNFDRLFETAARRTSQKFQAYSAPMLPIPKNSRWDGLIYLHGLLARKTDDTALNRLVLTSGDFGLAYLTERWAARFASELFRNYVVCFVGYSINDPVLRYMMDALAADRMLGESTPQAWAFGDYEPGHLNEKAMEWEAKGVTPILYEVPAGSHNHSALHKTLHSWAATYRDGILGKEQIVVSHALARPSASTKQDDFVGRMLWALSDRTGLPAKRFADFNPAPSLEWLLDAFSDERYNHGDLHRFGVPPHNDVDGKLRFSLVRRPAPYGLAPAMSLVSGGNIGSHWDDVMSHLARWLLRHLNDPELVIWIAQCGGKVCDSWSWLIESKIDQLSRLEHEGKSTELDSIRANAPNAVPTPPMRCLWRLLLAGRVKSHWRNSDLSRWKKRLKRDGLTAALRLELRDILEPKVRLSKPFRWGAEPDSSDEPTLVGQLVRWELVLAADYVHSTLSDQSDESWSAALPFLVTDFQQLLLDALDLLRELDGANDYRDRSVWDLPSISPHWQNRGFRDWATLIELLRDAWLEVLRHDPPRARNIAKAWFELPYPTFKRLALFAASHDDCIPPKRWVDWLSADGGCWLWSSNTMRETLRLLVLQGHNLARLTQERLEKTILAGPPLAQFWDDLEQDRRRDLKDRAIWLRLAKLNSSGLKLGTSAATRLAELSGAHPTWQLATNERDEFSIWRSSTGDPDYEESREVDIAPRKRRDLVEWLKQPPTDQGFYYEDTWQDSCRTRFFHSLFALCDLALEGVWPVQRWTQALQTWSGQDVAFRSWRYAAPLVVTMPDEVLLDLVHTMTWWLEAVSKTVKQHEPILLELCRRVLELPLEADLDAVGDGELVTEARNHPVGHVTGALLNLWLNQGPNDNDRLPKDIEPFFSRLCDTTLDQYRHGRLLLCSRVIAFFRVDPNWTREWLLPLFDWTRSATEARAAWQGFLWSPRIHQPLLTAFKSQLLETACHYADLGEYAHQFAAFLTYIAMETIEDYEVEEIRAAIAELPEEALRECAQALTQAMEGAGDQREEYWKNRVQPFWQHVWPKSLDLATTSLAEHLALLSIAAGLEFPSALAVVQDWLRPIEHPDYVVHQLCEADLCRQFPEQALRLLELIIDDQQWAPHDLGQCMEAIARVAPSLAENTVFHRLKGYLRRRS